jgi:hypothetical protein
LASFLPSDLPKVDAQGLSTRNFWVFGTEIPLQDLVDIGRGDAVHLRVMFSGSFFPYAKASRTEIHLEALLAEHALPLSRAAHWLGPRQWFYGDTHYHSAYTNDVKEFGGAVPEARKAALAIGLDWLVITDHSCDLDEKDAGYGGSTRWERLKAELTLPSVSDDKFRCILGEEITLVGRGEKYVHMLAIGAINEMIEGAFLPDNGAGFQAVLARETLEKLIKWARGYPPDIPSRLFGRIRSLEDVLSMLSQDVLTFAAHPFDVAQVPPAKWDEEDLANLRLTGYEFWNGRSRASASMTHDPFSRAAWTNQDRLQKEDRSRIKTVRRRAKEYWDPQLQHGVDEWLDTEALPSRRPVFVAGSDAHCDFNYHVGWAWDYRSFEVNDNALGRVRTIIHLPDHEADGVPETETILTALRQGSCLVTDGPVIESSLEHNGQVARMGEVLTISGDGNPEMKIQAHTTPEIGKVQQVEILTYFKGQRKKKPRRTVVKLGQAKTIRLDGLQGYCRVFGQCLGASGEGFCCFTNPIWVRIADGRKRRMRIAFG